MSFLFLHLLAHRFLLYLKLFLGMGLIWVFEILGGLSSTTEKMW